MNKFSIVIAVLAALAAVAAANKHIRHHRFENDDDFDGHHLSHGGHFRSPLQQLTSEELLEELSRRGHGHGHGHNYGGHGHRKGGRHGKRGLGRHGRHGFEGAGVGGLGGVGAAAGVGAVGGIEAQKERVGGIGGSAHLGERGSLEGHKSGLVAGEKHLNVGNHDDHLRDTEGSHKHQAFNNDKTIIKDSSSGVSDSDSFRNTEADSRGSNLNVGASGLAAKNAGFRAEGQKDVDLEAGAFGAEKESLAAGGAVGAVGGVGALGGAGAGAGHSD